MKKNKVECFFDYDGSFWKKAKTFFAIEPFVERHKKYFDELFQQTIVFHVRFREKIARTKRQVVQEKSLSFDFDIEFIVSAVREPHDINCETVTFLGCGGRNRITIELKMIKHKSSEDSRKLTLACGDIIFPLPFSPL